MYCVSRILSGNKEIEVRILRKKFKDIRIETKETTIYIYLHFLVIQAQERAEQSGQYEKQNNRHKDRGDNFFKVTSRGNAGFARSGPSPLRVLGNS